MYDRLQPLLFRLDAERAHGVGVGAARLAQALGGGLVERTFRYTHPALQQALWQLDFANPVGLAAGFDKNAQLVPFWQKLGFGFAEVGSVSARPAQGNPKPRAFRLEDDAALINRMGLNNQGARRVAARLRRARGKVRGFPVGVNLAKTHDPAVLGEAAIDDFRQSFRLLAPHAGYLALNISCPNTAEGKTFEDPEALDALLTAVFDERRTMGLVVPILLKLSPPASAKVRYDSLVEEVIALAKAHGVAGFIATNTASDREGLATAPGVLEDIGRGGLSGAPLEERSTHLVRYLYDKMEGTLPIIGVGGVRSAETAYAKIKAGASLVQLYTGLVYEGPGLVRRINEGLVRLLHDDGFTRIADAVGTG